VFRTGLLIDDDLRAAVDAQLAVKAPRWGVMDRSELAELVKISVYELRLFSRCRALVGLGS
jgi:hypothetical protein